MDASLPVVCGLVSTVTFVIGTLPMLLKAAKTRDLSSYSLGNIVLANVGNVVNTVYILSLPPGPVWALHGFNLVATALMLFWYVRYTLIPAHKSPWTPEDELLISPDAEEYEALIASSHHS
jgi:hypothetical protein